MYLPGLSRVVEVVNCVNVREATIEMQKRILHSNPILIGTTMAKIRESEKKN